MFKVKEEHVVKVSSLYLRERIEGGASPQNRHEVSLKLGKPKRYRCSEINERIYILFPKCCTRHVAHPNYLHIKISVNPYL
jgi:hypothetical protein